MLTKRVIACLDVVNGVVTKAVKFQDNIPISPAVEVMSRLYEDGVDEIIFYDIKASAEKRPIDLETVRSIADQVFIPFFTTRREGSGIGLSLSRQIMTAHGGDIVIESAGAGTRVRLVFP